MATNVIVLNSEPGIQRDGTAYDSKNYIDGQWVRFYRDRPLKIGGYKLIDQGNGTIIRTVYNYDNPDRPNTVDTYLGRADSVVYENFTLNGDGIGEVDRLRRDTIASDEAISPMAAQCSCDALHPAVPRHGNPMAPQLSHRR